jgi:hypothetical protein
VGSVLSGAAVAGGDLDRSTAHLLGHLSTTATMNGSSMPSSLR